ncbi:MAG: di-trans,poly-cis-decaprenylcistransferase [Myxococcales bacterium]|nr:di-trans,poly-cis-decaprenylcistransferase [Myxococcales bacterium]
MTTLDVRTLPKHVAITMDGNGRWAEQRGRQRIVGHRAGSQTVRRIVRAARRLGLEQLTLYAFSEQNWGRPQDEVEGLMALLQDFLLSEREDILNNNIRLRGVGNLSKLPEHVREVMTSVAQASQHNGGMVLSLALSYGGREEIVEAARSLARQAAAGALRPEAIDEEAVRALLPSLEYGEPDLMIRTGGEQRISNFLLWGSAYSELYFSDVLWPDYSVEDFYAALGAFQGRQRRFGLVPTGPDVVMPSVEAPLRRGVSPGSSPCQTPLSGS